ncbi:MAG: DUF5107 domain-containing protein [Clostridiales bacterium]|nr:DUF5107 domain-containing protein [Clostridiales bacterium]
MKKTDVSYQKLTLPTYLPGKAEELPIFFERRPYQGASGKLYPLPYTTRISDTKQDVDYNAAVLENEYIRVELLPEIGGKIQRAYDKKGEYDFIYHNKVIKPAMIGLAGPWISGGIEFNWPQHHRPTTFMPVETAITEDEKGEKTVWMGETEPLGRMRGMVGICVPDGRSYVMAKVRVYNRTPYTQPFMWWANLSVEINKDYKAVFPPDVEYVNDHDRRAVTGWPINNGIYRTARPFDYEQGTDLHEIPNVLVASSFMVSKGHSDADFLSGYDSGRERGVVTIANHHISPGKKLFHWGFSDFGKQWCANLTDDGSRYVELMTGCYTDNQPDFTWIMPYETKTFEQYWYPIREIGEIKNATIDAALNVEIKDGRLNVGVCPSGCFDNCALKITLGSDELYTASFSMTPDKPFVTSIDADGIDESKLTTSVYAYDGSLLVSYTPPVRGIKEPPKPRLRALPPEKIDTIEELWLNGRHLEQYKHFAFDPEDYYAEALRRDPGESRCNTAIGGLRLAHGHFEEAITYFDKAIERLTLRNFNPYDTEAYYKKGLALRFLGRYDDAYDNFALAAWSNDYRTPAYYELAKLDIRRGDTASAIEKLDKSLETSSRHVLALKLKNVLSPSAELAALISELDPLCFENGGKPEYFIDEAAELSHAGLNDKAAEIILSSESKSPLSYYWLAYLTGDREYIKAADALSPAYCFPSRLEDIAVLKYAASPMAVYYLGCLYYDRSRFDEAAQLWQNTIAALPDFAPAYRNSALYFFDKRKDFTASRMLMEKAFELTPNSDRIFYELVQLLKNTHISLDERLSLHEEHDALSLARDDCTMDRAGILTQLGEYEEAVRLLASHRFHTYEGGEGGLTRLHAWLKYFIGVNKLKNGDAGEAIEVLKEGFTFPECYGETKNYFAQEEHLNYALGTAYESIGDTEKAREYFTAATIDHSSPTYVSLWKVLSLRKLGRHLEADNLLDEMSNIADSIIAKKSMLDYFGVGAPSPMPFEGNYELNNEVKGLNLRAAALIGYGRYNEADEALSAAMKLYPDNFASYALNHLFDYGCDYCDEDDD